MIQWIAACSLFSSIQLLSDVVKKSCLSIWYTVGRLNPSYRKKCKIVVKLLTGNHALCVGWRHHQNNSSLCQMCDLYVTEDVCHLLFKCPGLLERRETDMQLLLDALPGVMKSEFLDMDDYSKTIFLLSGLRSGYIREWNAAFLAVCNYTSDMYRYMYLELHNLQTFFKYM